MIDVSASVVSVIKKGYCVEIDGQDCGDIVSVDEENNQITIEDALTANVALGALIYSLMR